MKISRNSLQDYLDEVADTPTLVERLTLAGLECESMPAAPDRHLHDVVVGRIDNIEPHPDADKLRLCQVHVGVSQALEIVCGAANAVVGSHVPVALPGATLPGGVTIKQSSVRGVTSNGMLCSAAELGLAESSQGLMLLDAAAEPGTPLAEWLQLDDAVIEFELTPNRGDCLSVAGIAREAAVLGCGRRREVSLPTVPVADVEAPAVAVDAPALCPIYSARVIAGVAADRPTPDWLRERLRRSGLRSVSAVVDITNLVMLESGQPLHAFDADRVRGSVRVRRAEASGEDVRLLNAQDYRLRDQELVIADDDGVLALAGVMGGERAEMRSDSTKVLLESACFLPAAVAGTGRRHRLHSDAVHRFERGVDPAAAAYAMARASALILEICGGRASEVAMAGPGLPEPTTISLRRARIEQILGVAVADARVVDILEGLGGQLAQTDRGWTVQAPSWRYDWAREVDLIEEIARIVGYDVIGDADYAAALAPQPIPEAMTPDRVLSERLGARGFQEVVSYSFGAAALDTTLCPDAARILLDNPIAEPYACMRSTLWTTLLPIIQYNVSRQTRRLRLFELGRSYAHDASQPSGILETPRLGGAMLGAAEPEHWAAPSRQVDFFDLKGELTALVPGLTAVAQAHPALHPGRSAALYRDSQAVGWMGELHPDHARMLELPRGLLLFEIDIDAVRACALPWAPVTPEFPSSRRDLSLEVSVDVHCDKLLETIYAVAPAYLRDVLVFDRYQGPELKKGNQSITLGLIFQDYSRTLTDEEIDEATKLVVEALGQSQGARIRG